MLTTRLAARFDDLHPNELRSLADGADVGEVTRRGADDVLYALDANRRDPATVARWALARSAWDALSDDERRGIIGPTTERASARGAETPSGALGSPPEEAGGKHV